MSRIASALDLLGERLVGEHEAVAQRVLGERLEILGEHVVAAADERERARRLHEADRPARAGAEGDVVVELGQAVLGRVARRGRERRRRS